MRWPLVKDVVTITWHPLVTAFFYFIPGVICRSSSNTQIFLPVLICFADCICILSVLLWTWLEDLGGSSGLFWSWCWVCKCLAGALNPWSWFSVASSAVVKKTQKTFAEINFSIKKEKNEKLIFFVSTKIFFCLLVFWNFLSNIFAQLICFLVSFLGHEGWCAPSRTV